MLILLCILRYKINFILYRKIRSKISTFSKKYFQIFGDQRYGEEQVYQDDFHFASLQESRYSHLKARGAVGKKINGYTKSGNIVEIPRGTIMGGMFGSKRPDNGKIHKLSVK